jgi:hypothetical protein
MDRLRAAPRRVWAVVLLGGALLTFRLATSGGDGVLDPERPALLPDVAEPGPAPASTVASPIRIPLTVLTDLLDEEIPTSYGDIEKRESLPDHERTQLAFHLRRGPFTASLEGSTATIAVTIAYAVRAFYDPPVLPEVSGSCGTDDDEARPRLRVTMRAPVAIDPSWRLHTRARVVDVVRASEEDRDECTVTFLDFDVTGKVVDAAREFLSDHVGQIDSLAAEADLRSSFEGWWRTLQEPISLTDSLWLVMRPETVERGPTRGEGDWLEIALALRARPTISYGRRPTLPYVELPPLDTAGAAEGLDLRVDARAEYGAASDFLVKELRGREIEREGHRVRLDSLSVFGIGGGRLAVELRVSGDVTGSLYLVGTPVIDPESGHISVPDLDFDLATRDVVVAAAAWLRADEVRNLLREKASWPAKPAVDFLSGWLEKGLNRELSEDLRVEGSVRSVRILGVRALRDALFVRVAATGAATLFVQEWEPAS